MTMPQTIIKAPGIELPHGAAPNTPPIQANDGRTYYLCLDGQYRSASYVRSGEELLTLIKNPEDAGFLTT